MTPISFRILRFFFQILAKLLFKLDVKGAAHIPQSGPVIIAANHISYLDWLLIASACPRAPRFTLYAGYWKRWITPLFRWGGTIPICSKAEDPVTYKNAFIQMGQYLDDDHIIVIFPEGTLTSDGKLHPFKHGIDKVLARNPVPVVPCRLSYALWDHWTSRKPGPKSFSFRPQMLVTFGQPLGGIDAGAEKAFEAIQSLKRQHL